jgi:crotonobetainyl-CoA:carnitine CoA-transferase CaiB-like acyl-CoA transferase
MGTPVAPLSGVRVIDLTIWVQGPLAGQLLADLGADVVKVEKPGQGDYTRGLQTLYGASMKTAKGTGLLWELVNRNKRALAIDLGKAKGRELLLALVREADVFLTNLRPTTLASFGASPEELMAANPRLIYALGTGLGVRGELADIPAQDTTATAYSGFMHTVAAGDEPYYIPGALADILSGTNLAFAVLAALMRREKTGKGEVVSTSLLQAMLWLQMLHAGAIANTGEHLQKFDAANAANAFINVYRCADGEWLALGMTAMGTGDWHAFCDVAGKPELKDDARFARNRGRIDHARDLIKIVQEVMAGRPRDEWLESIRAIGLPCAPVEHLEEVLRDSKVVSEGLLTQTASGMRFVRAPFDMEGVPVRAEDAPGFAADTYAVLSEAGLTAEEIAALEGEEVVW